MARVGERGSVRTAMSADGRLRLLDLFCGAGGATKGYQRAGFYVVGVDIRSQPSYCGDEFHQADAVALLREMAEAGESFGPWSAAGFDAIHASPPCQAYTTMNNRHGSLSPALIPETRRLLLAIGLPYVIENVAGARRELNGPVRLTGEMFGLRVHRPRLFETNWMLMAPRPPARQRDPQAVYGPLDGRLLWRRTDGSELRATAMLEDAETAMGIDWMAWDELREAIPPAYTELIGGQLGQLLQHVRASGGADSG